MLFEKGSQKFIKEFDAEYYVKSLRKLKTLMDSLMNDEERVISVYQHSNVVAAYDTNSSSDDGYSKIPKLFSKNEESIEDHQKSINNLM